MTVTSQALALDTEGTALAAGTDTGQILIWDIASRQVTADWAVSTRDRERVTQAANRMLEEAAQDPVRTLILNAAMSYRISVHGVDFSLAGGLLCSASGTGSVDFWSLRGRRVACWDAGTAAVRFVAYQVLDHAVTYLTDTELATRDLFTERTSVSCALEPGAAYHGSPFAVTSDGRSVAQARLDDVTISRPSHSDLPLRWSDWVRSVDRPHTAWDAGLADDDERLFGFQIVAMAWSATVPVLAIANDKGIIQQWLIGDQPLLVSVASATENGQVAALAPYEDGFKALCATEEGDISLWHSGSGRSVRLGVDRAISPCRITATAFHWSGDLLAAAFSTGEIGIWHTDGNLVAHLPAFQR